MSYQARRLGWLYWRGWFNNEDEDDSKEGGGGGEGKGWHFEKVAHVRLVNLNTQTGQTALKKEVVLSKLNLSFQHTLTSINRTILVADKHKKN